MREFHLSTAMQPLDSTRGAANSDRSQVWVRRAIECHYYRPFASAYWNLEQRTIAAEPVAERDSVESDALAGLT
jgi:hypothetical protein